MGQPPISRRLGIYRYKGADGAPRGLFRLRKKCLLYMVADHVPVSLDDTIAILYFTSHPSMSTQYIILLNNGAGLGFRKHATGRLDCDRQFRISMQYYIGGEANVQLSSPETLIGEDRDDIFQGRLTESGVMGLFGDGSSRYALWEESEGPTITYKAENGGVTDETNERRVVDVIEYMGKLPKSKFTIGFTLDDADKSGMQYNIETSHILPVIAKCALCTIVAHFWKDKLREADKGGS